MLVDLANQARQNSMSKGVMTALVMVLTSPNTQANGRLFILMDLEGQENASTLVWTPISKWYQLPDGLMVDSARSSFAQSSYQPTLPQALANLTYQGAAIDPDDCVCQVFMAGGQLAVKGYNTLQSPNLRLTQEVNGTLLGGGTADYYDITFNLYTGTATVDRP